MKKNILIINTGGTISSIHTNEGYAPANGVVESALEKISGLKHPDMPHYHILEYNPLLDSSNMRVQDWNRIAQDISTHNQTYDGFLIFHGTDTMSYTASALSFMLEHLGKPVIITGSQIPLSKVRNDAYDNILTGLWLCANAPISEVCIYFNQKLLRGNRSQKVSALHFAAFDSPNFPPLANIGIHIALNKNLLLKKPKQALNLQNIAPHFIANFRLFPGFSSDVLAALLAQPIKGLILETYGSGNAQNNDPKFLETLRVANARGIIIVNCSQCHQGYVNMEQYATGRALLDAGLISGFDMTPEAAHCKLMYLFSKGLQVDDIKSRMQENLVGELGSASLG